MKYQVSPLLLFSAIAFGALMVVIFVPDPKWGSMAIYQLISVIIVSLAIDFTIQKFSKSHMWTCIIEVVMILVFLIIIANVLF
jgi:FtsH-binding integral membrane protein